MLGAVTQPDCQLRSEGRRVSRRTRCAEPPQISGRRTRRRRGRRHGGALQAAVRRETPEYARARRSRSTVPTLGLQRKHERRGVNAPGGCERLHLSRHLRKTVGWPRAHARFPTHIRQRIAPTAPERYVALQLCVVRPREPWRAAGRGVWSSVLAGPSRRPPMRTPRRSSQPCSTSHLGDSPATPTAVRQPRRWLECQHPSCTRSGAFKLRARSAFRTNA